MVEAGIVPSTLEHVEAIASDMRPEDIEELKASTMMSPCRALKMAMEQSAACWTGTADGVPACMFGVCPVGFFEPEKGRPWLLSSRLLDHYAVTFIKLNRECVEQMLNRFPVLENFVSARNRRAVRWLKWLGFCLSPAVPMGRYGVPFHRFEMRR